MSDVKRPVVVRDATMEDATLLSALGERTFRDTYGADNSPAEMDSFVANNYGPEVQAAELLDLGDRYLIAESDGTAVGFVLLSQSAHPAQVPGRRPLMLSRIYVDLPYKGRGVGAALMGRSIQEARQAGHDALWLTVWARNPAAIAFYRRWGFEEVGVTKFLLGDEMQDDLLMVLNLSTAQ